MTPKDKARALAEALRDKRAEDIRVLDLAEMRSFCDCFVLATATSDRHAKTLADAVREACRTMGERPIGVEGESTARWILIDCADVVVHVFQAKTREFYGLERLWGEAETVPLAAGDAG